MQQQRWIQLRKSSLRGVWPRPGLLDRVHCVQIQKPHHSVKVMRDMQTPWYSEPLPVRKRGIGVPWGGRRRRVSRQQEGKDWRSSSTVFTTAASTVPVPECRGYDAGSGLVLMWWRLWMVRALRRGVWLSRRSNRLMSLGSRDQFEACEVYWEV